MHLLDRPVWASLNAGHAHLALGGSLARRYAPDVNLFASTCDDGPVALAALSALIPAGSQIYLAQRDPIVVPPGFALLKAAKAVQLVGARGAVPFRDPDIAPLTAADAPDMLALACLTEPGPFLERTHTMGRFLGIRIDGRLAAMAGERFRFAGHTEVSGVCTHPEFRGRGLARRLSQAVAAAIEARAERPFLHAWTTNRAAISLYESLGFEVRAEMEVAAIERLDAAVD